MLFIRMIILVFFLLMCFQCSSPEVPLEVNSTREYFHTLFSIRIFSPYPDSVNAIMDQAWQIAEKIERVSNFYNHQSALWEMNNRLALSGTVPVQDTVLRDLVELSIQLTRESGGGFDPTVGGVALLWPFGQEQPIPPSVEIIRQHLALVNGKHLRFSGDTLLAMKGQIMDFSGVNKGYAVDRIIGFLKQSGVVNAIVDAGGNLGILWHRKDTILVGIRHPEEPATVIAEFGISRPVAIATSGDYMNFFEYHGNRYHHVLDPRTGFPSDSASSVTVITTSAARADGLSTGLFVKGVRFSLDYAQKVPECWVIFIEKKRPVIHLPSNFPFTFSLKDSSYRIQYE